MRETTFFIFQAPRQHHHLHQERSPSRQREGPFFFHQFQALLGHLCHSGHPQAGQKEALTGQEQQQQHLPLFFKLLTAPAAAATTGQQQRPPHAFREEEASDVRGSSSRSRRRRSEQEEELHQEVRSWFKSGAKEGPVGEEQGEAAAATEGTGAEAAAAAKGPCASQAARAGDEGPSLQRGNIEHRQGSQRLGGRGRQRHSGAKVSWIFCTFLGMQTCFASFQEEPPPPRPEGGQERK